MKIAIIVGTRPEIIKMSPIIRECEKRKLNDVDSSFDYFILQTGQHYSYEMDQVFFKQLKLPDAKYNLDVGSGSHGTQTGKILSFDILFRVHHSIKKSSFSISPL